jgi:Phytoene/squalene synthetase
MPEEAFDDLVDGAEQDVRGASFETFDELEAYCRRVAGSIGRLSVGVFGAVQRERAFDVADRLGVAFQLTNIVRDVAEDLANGRVYLPQEDLEAFGVDLADPGDGFAELVRFECSRAERWYDDGMELLPLLDRSSAASTATMASAYRRLLRRIERDPDAVLTRASRCRRGRRVGSPRAAWWGKQVNEAVVVGGGLAGITAALDLAEAGRNVTLLEARPRLGGATFSVERDGLWVDNGQHVFLRCCTAYRGCSSASARRQTELQERLAIPVLRPGGRVSWLRRTGLPAPLHLGGSIARFGPLPPLDRLRLLPAIVALRRLSLDDPELDQITFGEWLERHGQRTARSRRCGI